MGHRQLFFPSQTSNMDSTDIWNLQFPDPPLHPGIAMVPYLPETNLYLYVRNSKKIVNCQD